MNSTRKTYETPRVTVHGTVGELTLQGGGGLVDVPGGTPTNVPGGITGTHYTP
jgi:hypothetical protein